MSQARVARRWEVPDLTPEAAQAIRHNGLDAVPSGSVRLNWSSTFAKVSGNLPLDDLRSIKIPYQSATTGLVRCQVHCTTGGKVKLVLGSADGIKLWLDKSPLETGPEMELQLSPGTHAITFAVELDRRKEPIRCELADVPGSGAQAQFVAGN